jgi:hypothetical protein
LALILVLLSLTTGTAFAQSEATKQVGLVISFADGSTQTKVVTVPSNATALDALKASDLTIETSETQFGPALCKINTSGCPATNCFCDAEHFWAYYHSDGGAWKTAAESAGAYVPADRAVEGFAWSGFDAQFAPNVKPPVYTFDQLLGTPRTMPSTGYGVATLLLVAGGLAVLAGYALRRGPQA